MMMYMLCYITYTNSYRVASYIATKKGLNLEINKHICNVLHKYKYINLVCQSSSGKNTVQFNFLFFHCTYIFLYIAS